MFIAAERCAPSIDFQRLQEGSGPEALNPGLAATSPSTWLSATRSPPPRRDQGRLPVGSLPAAGQHRRRHPSKAMPVPGTEPRCDNSPAGGAGPAPLGREKLAAAGLCTRTRAKGVPRGAPRCRRGICSPPATPVGGKIGHEFWTGGGSPWRYMRRASSRREPRSWARRRGTSSCISPAASQCSAGSSSSLPLTRRHGSPRGSPPPPAALGRKQCTKCSLDFLMLSMRASCGDGGEVTQGSAPAGPGDTHPCHRAKAGCWEPPQSS